MCKHFICFLFLSSFMTAQTSLFNGQDLEGWTIHGTEKWYVDTGELICESGPDAEYGYLSTNAFYNNFELTLEFKQEANGNSGVFFRSTLEGTKITGWQVEVAPPCPQEPKDGICPGDATGGIYESYGRGWLIKPDYELDKNLKMGDWNKMRVLVQGNRVQTFLNGVAMVDMSDTKIGAGKGSIALQIHSGGGIKVRWRNIQLKTL